jgi:multidrug efflux pump
VVFVFLVLAAQYESWALPLAVILVVPMCLLCSIIGVGLARMEVTIFTQIGFVVLVGLASKSAILIVEFAKQQRDTRRDLLRHLPDPGFLLRPPVVGRAAGAANPARR